MASWDEPPRFGPNGEAPPVRTDPVLLSDGFTLRIAPTNRIADLAISRLLSAAGLKGADVQQAREWLLRNYSPRALTALQTKGLTRTYLTAAQALLGREAWATVLRSLVLFRLQRYYFWEREDPLTRLSVGANGKITRKVVVGLSTAASHEITASLGSEANVPGLGKISDQQAIKDAITLTRTEQREDSRELTLPSPASGTRRYAIWQRVSELHVEALAARKDEIYWRLITTETFNAAPAIVATSDAET